MRTTARRCPLPTSPRPAQARSHGPPRRAGRRLPRGGLSAPRTAVAALALALARARAAAAYIPALPVNDTSALNLTDDSTISIAWADPAGVFSGGVSYQLRADVATGGTTAGALVHFTEGDMGDNVTTATPWVAYISCDANETDASQEWDIFTLARDRGAVSALLYTTTAESCLIDPTYVEYFEKPLDVFATQTKQVARVVEAQFENTNSTFYNYSSSELNQSAAAVNESLAGGYPTFKTFLVGTLVARNSTGQAEPPSDASATATANTGAAGTHKSTNLAAIIAPSIIGSLIALTLLSMCRRAWRRARARRAAAPAHDTGRPLAKAVVDSFPLVTYAKSAHGGTAPPPRAPPPPPAQRLASTASTAPLLGAHDAESSTAAAAAAAGPARSPRDSLPLSDEAYAAAADVRARAEAAPAAALVEMRATAAQYEADECAICLAPYADGDQVRQLLCAGKHRFHRGCVDEWLVNNEGSCPLCRQAIARYIAARRARRRQRRDTLASESTLDGGGSGGSAGVVRARPREADQGGPGGY